MDSILQRTAYCTCCSWNLFTSHHVYDASLDVMACGLFITNQRDGDMSLNVYHYVYPYDIYPVRSLAAQWISQ